MNHGCDGSFRIHGTLPYRQGRKSGHSAAERPLRGPVSGSAEGDVMANLSAERNAAKSANSSTLGIFLEPQDFYYIAKYERRALGINGERG